MFDVKIDFTRKVRWVLDGDKTLSPLGCTHAGVVSRENVRIAFVRAELNGLEVFEFYVRNAYLQNPSSEKELCNVWH